MRAFGFGGSVEISVVSPIFKKAQGPGGKLAPRSSKMTVPADEDEQGRHDLIARRAYELWELRGSPWGSPEQDWLTAAREFDDSELRLMNDASEVPFSDFGMEATET
jgi:hypothetical protein